jgi:hypothetical protein
MTRFVIFIVFLFNAYHSYTQTSGQVDPAHALDNLFTIPDEDNNEEVYENTLQRLSQHINLNKASAEDLRFYQILTEAQIQSLLAYRQQHGALLSIYELQAVPGFDLSTIEKMKPWIMVRDPLSSIDRSLWNRIKDSEGYLLMRYDGTFQNKKGFSSSSDSLNKFQGSPGKKYCRLKLSRPGDYSFGFTLENDAGERLTWDPSHHQYGADFFSFHAQLQNKGVLQNIVVGDFQSQFAQGIMLGGGFGMGKGGEPITTVRKANIGLIPYTSSYETNAFTGIGTTLAITKKINLTSFYAYNRRDGSLKTDDQLITVSSFQFSGLHRNTRELLPRKQLPEQNAAAIIQYQTASLDVGAIVHHTAFEYAIAKVSRPYNQFNFQGRTNLNSGFYVNYNFRNFAFFSEFSKTIHHGSAAIAGVLSSITSKLDVALLFRKYDRDYYTFYSNAFGESTNTQNETGIYWGWKYKINSTWTAQGYFDMFNFPWLRFRNYAPSNGHEALLRLIYTPSKKIMAFIQGREELKPRNVSSPNEAQTYQTGDGVKRNYWVSVDFGIRQQLRLKSRFQYSTFTFNHSTTSGRALVQDISVTANRLQVTGRYALFDTDDYDNRQYVYENDVWLAFSLPSYSGKGLRSYLLVEYRMSKRWSIWLRYAHTRYIDRDAIGSGADVVQGNVLDDWRIECRWNW